MAVSLDDQVISLEQYVNFPDGKGVSHDDIEEDEDASGAGIPRAAEAHPALVTFAQGIVKGVRLTTARL